MSKRDYYEILGLNRNASQDEIKKAYRTLARKYHPDVNKEKGAESKFKEINEAYEVLKDPTKKNRYDRYGHNGVDNDHGGFGGFGGGTFEDIFSSFFGGGFQQKQNQTRPRKGNSFQSKITISFMDAVTGKTIEQNMKKHVLCSQCNGSGANSVADIVSCNTCKGTGSMSQHMRTPFGVVESKSTCSSCNGVGKVIKTPCRTCKGKKHVIKDIKTKITIPQGIKSGQQVVVEGFGGPGINGGPSGDLILIVMVENHMYYVRKENDIHLDVPISIIDVMNENKISIPTPYGPEIIELSDSLKSGDILTLKNKGFKQIGANKFGDLKLHVNLFIPKMSKKEKELLKEFLLRFGDNDQFSSWCNKVKENKK